ncbi:hypothetical protein D5086_027996 [Populus alba]|uniref:Uncharacterized protein n=1 Tax=Populus alba TaxID=43335 RepID=A0ACC4AWW4_POPAL
MWKQIIFFSYEWLLRMPLVAWDNHEVDFSMENSDDEKDGVFGNCMPKELSISLANGTKFVDEESLPPLEVEQPIMQVENPALDIAFGTEQLEFSSQLRDSIAGDMWGDYISDLSAM